MNLTDNQRYALKVMLQGNNFYQILNSTYWRASNGTTCQNRTIQSLHDRDFVEFEGNKATLTAKGRIIARQLD